MSYKYLDHGADIGIEARGRTLPELFVEGAKGLFSLMVKLDSIEARKSENIALEASDYTELYYEWLAELLSVASLNQLVLSEFSVEYLSREADSVVLKGSGSGEKLEPGKHEIRGEVKAITYQGLKLVQKGELWVGRCVVDV
ncbi:MAG: archease [Candidatus Bipolaricaulota bacterium]